MLFSTEPTTRKQMTESPTITSMQNQRVKDACRLRDRRGRQDQQRIIIDGTREIDRALDANCEIVELFVRQDDVFETATELLQLKADARGVEIIPVSPQVFGKLAFGARAEGVVAVGRPPHKTLAELQLGPKPVVAVLEGLEKPGNVGAVIRSADGAGVAAVIVVDGGTDLYNPNAIRASLGTAFTVPLVDAPAQTARDWLEANSFQILTARVGAGTNYTDISYGRATALVLGSESHGLSDIWQGDGVTPISLPMLGVADSLNVSVTAALLFYEALRQA
jgi:TrmH family RNA methyltransferase